MVADIPFAFSVREKTLPAGEYTGRCVNPDSSMKVLLISSKTIVGRRKEIHPVMFVLASRLGYYS